MNEQTKDVCQCTLCGSCQPWTCEHCSGVMTLPPYSVQTEGKKFIGSGEDAHMFFVDNND